MSEEDRRLDRLNPYENRMIRFILFYACLPVVVVMVFFYLIFCDVIKFQLGSDTATTFTIRFVVLSIFIFLFYLLFAKYVFNFVHRIAGGYPRLLREINEAISNKSKTSIRTRDDDYFKELIERINVLIAERS